MRRSETTTTSLYGRLGYLVYFGPSRGLTNQLAGFELTRLHSVILGDTYAVLTSTTVSSASALLAFPYYLPPLVPFTPMH